MPTGALDWFLKGMESYRAQEFAKARDESSKALTLHASFDRGYAAPTVARSGGRVMTHGRGAAA